MADLYGSIAWVMHGTASASLTADVPAGLTGHTQLLCISYKDKSATMTTPGGWSVLLDYSHSTAVGRLIVLSKVLGSGASATTQALSFSATVVAETIGASFSGVVDVSSSAAETGWTTTVTPPSLTSSTSSAVYFSLVANVVYPRNASVAAPGIQLVSDRVTPPEVPTLNASKKVVAAEAVTGSLFTFSNPYPYGNDSETIAWSVIFMDTGSPPAGPPPSGTPTSPTMPLATFIARMQATTWAKIGDGSDPPAKYTTIRMPINKAFWDLVYPPLGAQHNTHFDSFAPWFWAFLNENNSASGKRLEVRRLRAAVLLDGTAGTWWDSGVRAFQRPAANGQAWDGGFQYPYGDATFAARVRNESSESVSIGALTGNQGVELWCSDYYINFGRSLAARAFCHAWIVECRVINSDGTPYTGADAKFTVNCGYDPYNSSRDTPYNAQFASSIYPNAADGGNPQWIVVDGSMGWTSIGGIGVTGTDRSFVDGPPPPFGNFTGSPSTWLGDDSPYVLTPTQLAANPPAILISGPVTPPTGGGVTVINNPTHAKFSAVSSIGIYAIATTDDNQTQAIVLTASVGSGVTVTMPAGWTLREATAVDSYPNRMFAWTRTLATATATEYITVTFTGGTASGIILSFLAEGIFLGSARNTATQSDYSLTLTPPVVTPSTGNATAVSFIGSSQYPRGALPGSAMTLRMDDWQASTSGGVSLTMGHQDVSSSSATLGTWAPYDPETPGAEAGEWWRAITLLFSSAAAPAGGDVTVTAAGNLAFLAAPTNGAASAITATTASISWTDNSSDETGFIVRKFNTLTEEITYTSAAANATSVTLTGLSAGVLYNVAVFAERGTDISAPTNAVLFTTLAGSAFALTATDLTVGPGEFTTITAQTSPATVGATVYLIWDSGSLEIQSGYSTVTDGSGAASATFKGLAQDGLAQVTFTIEGVTRSIMIGTTSINELPVLKINPARLEKDSATQAIVTGDVDGRALIGKTVTITSSVPSVVAEPSSQIIYAVPGGGGEARFSLRGLENGTTVITATVDGEHSNPVTMVVEQPEAPFSIAASGVSIVSLTAESPLAVAGRARPRRLTHADLFARYPGESGLQLADVTAKTNYVFITAAQIRETT